MSQNLLVSVLGLSTNNNQIGKVPPGSLTVASNINIDRDGVAESRRGFEYFNIDLSLGTPNVFDRLVEFEGFLIAHNQFDDTMYYYDAGWNALNPTGPFIHPDPLYARMRFLKSSQNLYFTTNDGVKVLNSYNGIIYNTGMPKGLDGSAVTSGATGWMVKNTQVAYRVVWGSRDIHNNLYLGTPSQRIILINPNTGHDTNAAITFTIPAGITVDDFFQVYRSRVSASETDEPNDELQLVYESNPTAGQITARSVSFTDSCPTTLMGAFLYTNSSQEGLSQANDEPPVAKDLCLFKGFTFYANIRTKYKLFVSLLAVDSTTGLQLNDTITIDGMVFTAKAAENIANREFLLSTTGSAAQNVENTAKSLVRVVNQYTSNTSIYAYYMSSYTELPGQMMFETRTIGTIGFSVSVSRSTVWDINDGQADNEEFLNGLAWSKIQQPEHVPAANLEKVGSNNYEIRRILALRDSVFILKDDGIYRLTGQNGTWSIDPLDTSTRIIAPDSAVVVNNQIFCLSDQGIVAISDIGVEIKSIPIENQIKELYSIDLNSVKQKSFGIAYDTDRKYIFFTIDQVSDTTPTKAFVYNTITNKWTTWSKAVVHGIISSSNDKMYLCEANSSNILEERKSFTEFDFADESISGFTISSFSGTTVSLNSILGINIGDVLYQTNTQLAVIQTIDTINSTVTVNTNVTWSIGPATVVKAIDCELEFTNLTNDNAGVMKHYQEIAWLFREKGFLFASTSFYTDLSGGYDDIEIVGDYGGGNWGAFIWGDVPWGGVQRPKPVRVFMSREKSRGSLLSIRLSIRNAFAQWSLNGVSVQFDFVSERMTRS